jgi:hypothetical protein
MRNAPPTILRALALARLAEQGYATMVTVEPVMDFDLDKMLRLIRMTKAMQVNIGADSGNNHLPEPSPEKVASLIETLRSHNIKVYLKPNLKRLYKEAA